MSERLPKHEVGPKLTREAVVDTLRLGYLLPFTKYLDQCESEGKTSRDTLLLNIETAEIYRDAGFIEESQATFKDAAEQAFQECEDILYGRIMAELEKL
jgi:hypothetical protein